MIHAILLISGSGLVLYQKEFAVIASTDGYGSMNQSINQSGNQSVNQGYLSLTQKSGQLGGILTAIVNFCANKIGGIPQYLEFDHICVSLARSNNQSNNQSNNHVTCAVFHAHTETESFGRLIANEFLNSFVHTYRQSINQSINRSDQFSSFTSKLSSLVSACLRPVLNDLVKMTGIEAAMIAQSDSSMNDDLAINQSISPSINQGGSNRERLLMSINPSSRFDQSSIDSMTIVSSHDRLFDLSLDVLSFHADTPISMSFRSNNQSIYVRRFQKQRCSLIVVYQSVNQSTMRSSHSTPTHQTDQSNNQTINKAYLSNIKSHIKQYADLLQSVVTLAHNLKS